MKQVQSSISSFLTGCPAKSSKTETQITETDSTTDNLLAKDNPQPQSVGQASTTQPHVVRGCIDPGWFAKWKRDREWLTVSPDGSVKCSACADIKELGPYTQQRLHVDPAFINGVTAKSSKKLNDKINNH